MSNGIQVTQEGIPVDKASDYQKVLDSRWQFMEVAHEIDTTITVPAAAIPPANTVQRVNIMKHNLTNKGKAMVPAMHGSWLQSTGDINSDQFYDAGIYADSQYIFFQRANYSGGSGLTALTIKVKIKVYNLDILGEYLAFQEIPRGSGRVNTKYGLTALDGSDSSVTVNGSASHGYSIDTRKKILSIHKVGQKDIYAFPPQTARVTAINTTSDVATIDLDPNEGSDLYGKKYGLSWVQTGVQVSLSPSDFVTYPSPLSSSVQPFIIKTGTNTIKFASTQANAMAGTAIDLTTTGSLPMTMRRMPDSDDGRFPHESEYPPSYFFCNKANNEMGTGLRVGVLMNRSFTPLVRIDRQYLYFTGVQAAYNGALAIIILKDPIEVAG